MPAVVYPTATHYSEHLTRKELDCRCGCRTPPAIVVALTIYARSWEKIRAILGYAVTINCGYRCPKHNASLPGAALYSQHLYGKASDNSTGSEAGVIAIARAALQVPAIRGISIYNSAHGQFCHTDNRTGPRWLAVNGGRLATDQEPRFRRCLAAGRFVA